MPSAINSSMTESKSSAVHFLSITTYFLIALYAAVNGSTPQLENFIAELHSRPSIRKGGEPGATEPMILLGERAANNALQTHYRKEVFEVQDILVKQGVTEHRYEHGTVRVHAPRDIKLKDWNPAFQSFLSSMEKGKAVSKSA